MTPEVLRSYEEPVKHSLPDGTAVEIRAVHPKDRVLLARGFEQFGPESRYLRFFTAKQHLTDHELDYLTSPDGYDHFAIGAVRVDAVGREEPLGIARFVRLEHDGEVAEPAVAVIDSMQGKGLGKLLLRLLADAAYERGVRRFRSSVLASNTTMQKMFEELDPHVHVVSQASGIAELDVELTPPSVEPEPAARENALERLLAMVAKELVAVRHRNS